MNRCKVWGTAARAAVEFAAVLLLSTFFLAGSAWSQPIRSAAPLRVGGDRPNVLLILVDDLRPELACYGARHIHSPNIDRLAAGGIQFDRAYCMVPTCGASRAALMTGLRPTPQRFLKHSTRINRDAPRALALHENFRQAGYTTVSIGKVIHHPQDRVAGWSVAPWVPETMALDDEETPGGRGPAFNITLPGDITLLDEQIASRAESQLKELADSESPFFLAVGFLRPHLPFTAPQASWDTYDAETIDIPRDAQAMRGIPSQALHNSAELRNYQGIPKSGPMPDSIARQLIHGYYASVTYVDSQVGRVLDALQAAGLSDNTIVVLWGDHGWNLGEHGLWCKHCCFETSMRIPMIIRVPGGPAGVRVSGLVESIDLYPTLCEFAGLTAPRYLHGQSFASRIAEPASIGKGFAIGRFAKGETLRTDEYRYTEYYDEAGTQIVARTLFDHRSDPAELENLADLVEHRAAVESLSKQLHEVIDILPLQTIGSPRRR